MSIPSAGASPASAAHADDRADPKLEAEEHLRSALAILDASGAHWKQAAAYIQTALDYLESAPSV